jgi:hypothetical protein
MTICAWLFLAFAAAAAAAPARAAASPGASVLSLLPQVAGWRNAEEPKRYGPDTLFEYIDGAAEAFLNYDFLELGLGQYKKPSGTATLTVEIYDMGAPLNAFGIYSTERYPESKFLPIGVQGYLEEGTLNFLAGRYYVKMMAYEAGPETEAALRAFAGAILAKIGNPGGFPPVLAAFPKAGLVANSEKYVLKNFLGLEFLKNGAFASYKLPGGNPDAFAVEAASDAEAASLLEKFSGAAAAKGASVEKRGALLHWKDPYLDEIFAGRAGRYLYGVTKVKEGSRAAGESLAAELGAALAK